MFTPRLPIGRLISGLLVGLLVLVAVGCDGMGAVQEDQVVRDDNVVASKLPPVQNADGLYVAFKDAVPATIRVGGTDVDVTKFIYTVTAPSDGAHIALEDPGCATFVAASGATTDNNGNGEVEWHSGIPTSGTGEIWYAFAGAVPTGAVKVSLKTQSNTITDAGVTYGPCRGYIEVDVNGTVFLDRDKNGNFDPGDDSGIAGTAVRVEEPFPLVSQVFTAGDGSYHFGPDFIFPWWLGASPYRYQIIAAPGQLSLFSPSCGADACSYGFTVTDSPETQSFGPIDIGFYLNVKQALENFNNGVAVSDGLDRTFWKVQATGKGTQKYRPVISTASLLGFARDFLTSYPTSPHYSGVSSETPDAELLLWIQNLVQAENNNDEYLWYKTATFVLGLNRAAERGLCNEAHDVLVPGVIGEDLIPDYPVCSSGADLTSTGMVIEQALGELDILGANKAPTGTGEVVDRLNGG